MNQAFPAQDQPSRGKVQHRGFRTAGQPGNPAGQPSIPSGQPVKSAVPAAIQFSEYEMPLKEKIAVIVMAGAVCFGLGMIFFKFWLPALLLSSAALLYPKIRRKQIIRKRKEELKLQFQQALNILSSALAVGRSVENAFQSTLIDLKWLYPDDRSYIIQEFDRMNRRMQNGEPIEKALMDFSLRAEVKDISEFVDVFVICKRTGGNLVDVIRTSAHMISDKLEIQREIAVMIAQKKFESKILSVFPVGLIAFLAYGSPEYMAPMYEGAGMLVMAAALALMTGCFLWSQKIMEIEV